MIPDSLLSGLTSTPCNLLLSAGILSSNMTSPPPDPECTNMSFIDGVPANEMDPSIMKFRQIVHNLDLYLVPCLAVGGILGNILSFLVFVGTYLKHMSSSVYLAGLAVSDSVFLLMVFLSWSSNVNIYIYHRPGWCHLFVYLAYVSSFLSVWYVVCFTVERYIAVCFPLKRQDWCTARRARIVVTSLAVAAILLYTYALWTSEVMDYYGRPFCSVKTQYYQMVLAIGNADTLITLLLPTIVIVGSNIRITYALAQFFMQHHHHHDNSETTSWTASCPHTTDRDHCPRGTSSSVLNTSGRYSRTPSIYIRHGQGSSYNRLQMKVTKMLLLVSTTFLICNIPSHAIRVYTFFVGLVDDSYKPSHKFLLIQKLTQFLYYSNFSVNFLLYNISGRAFRRAMLRLFATIKDHVVHIVQTQHGLLCSKVCSRSRSRSRTWRIYHLHYGKGKIEVSLSMVWMKYN